MFVIGTAGHIDHGKSLLIEKLTGIDPDRLREEKERGMTIDLGFAWLKLPSGNEVGIIDVPGHERFVKNMLAGVGGIDLALLVVAANEGVMPQTREHLAILDLLEIRNGIAVITKKDIVDDELLELVKMEVEELVQPTTLSNVPILSVSALTGEGLPELLSAIDSLLAHIEPKKDIGRPRLFVDRIFTIVGAGTVVTGTLIDGILSQGQDVEIQPRGLTARLRGLQSHKNRVDTIGPGNRVAANLAGVTTADIQRGNVITSPGWLKPTSRIDGKLRMLDNCKHPLRHGSMVTFFTGTEEVMARVHLLEGEDVPPGQSAWVQFTLARTVAAVKGDHYIIRSPMDTLGGGTIISAAARRHRRFRSDVLETLEAIGTGSSEDTIYAILESRQPLTKEQLSVLSNVSADELEQTLKRLIENKRITSIADGSGRFLFTAPGWVKLTRQAVNKLKEYHAKFPARSGMPKGELTRKLNISSGSPILQRMFTDGLLIDTGAEVRLPEYEIKLSREQREKVDTYLHQLQKNPYAPPDASSIEPDLLKMLIDQGQVIRVTGGIIFSKAAYDDMVGKVLDYARQNGSISLAQVRDMFSNSRKYAQALLDHMDDKKLTRRVGDLRVAR